MKTWEIKEKCRKIKGVYLQSDSYLNFQLPNSSKHGTISNYIILSVFSKRKKYKIYSSWDMNNFVGTLLAICIHFFLVVLKFLLILILNKLDNSFIFPLGKTVMHRLKSSILFATLGQLAAKILVIL